MVTRALNSMAIPGRRNPGLTGRVSQSHASSPVLICVAALTISMLMSGVHGANIAVTVSPSGAFQFSPSSVTINVGDTVVWTWGGNNHNVVQVGSSGSCTALSGGFASSLLNTGATYNHTFTTAGTFFYVCTPHCSLGQQAQIIVKAASTTAAAVPQTSSASMVLARASSSASVASAARLASSASYFSYASASSASALAQATLEPSVLFKARTVIFNDDKNSRFYVCSADALVCLAYKVSVNGTSTPASLGDIPFSSLNATYGAPSRNLTVWLNDDVQASPNQVGILLRYLVTPPSTFTDWVLYGVWYTP
eukprot:Opistho-1_new@50064